MVASDQARMEFDWSEDALTLRAHAKELGVALSAGVEGDDRLGRFPREKWDRLAEWGYFGLSVPTEFGGANLDPFTALAVSEGLGEGCADGGLLFSAAVQAWVVAPAILRFGTEDQKRRFLPGLVAGTAVGAFAISEADSGSDAFAMRTRAGPVDGGWRLSGRKAYVTNGPVADTVVCFAATGPGGALGGTTAFLVQYGADGFERGPANEKMGLRTSPLGDLLFDDVFVPGENVLGRPGLGVAVFNDVLEWERIWPMAVQLGALARELDAARTHASARKTFGAPIGRNQAVSNRLVDMKVRLEAARLLLYQAAWRKARGEKAMLDSAIAKLFLSESMVASSLDCLQIHGAYGYMSDAGIERGVRDAVGSRLYSGTTEMMRAVVARSLGL